MCNCLLACDLTSHRCVTDFPPNQRADNTSPTSKTEQVKYFNYLHISSEIHSHQKNLQSELQQECDFKEILRDELSKKEADLSPNYYNDTYAMLTEEIRNVVMDGRQKARL